MLGRARIFVVGAFLMGLLVWFGLHQYSRAEKASVKTDILGKAVSGAVVERKKNLIADHRVRQEIGTTLDPVRQKLAIARKEVENAEGSTAVDRCTDADRIRLWNDAVRAGNAAIAASGSLP